uniref:Uncharacterized protein n=1 Tax=Glossina austeni TaxID=7395 RepID=A0A1A9VB48_GLOAU
MVLGLPHVYPKIKLSLCRFKPGRLLVSLMSEVVARMLTVFIGLLREPGRDGATSDVKATLLIVALTLFNFKGCPSIVPGFLISVGLALVLLGLLITAAMRIDVVERTGKFFYIHC